MKAAIIIGAGIAPEGEILNRRTPGDTPISLVLGSLNCRYSDVLVSSGPEPSACDSAQDSHLTHGALAMLIRDYRRIIVGEYEMPRRTLGVSPRRPSRKCGITCRWSSAYRMQGCFIAGDPTASHRYIIAFGDIIVGQVADATR